MYERIAQEMVEPGSVRRFLGERTRCRYCGVTDLSAFGKRTNAHTFPAALGNRTLFSLDECRACNGEFSVYEDALCKAVGPFLTLGGVRGRTGVRKTGLSGSKSTMRHAILEGKRQLSIKAEGDANRLVGINEATGLIKLTMPVEGDVFVPLYAYKALMKIGLSMLPFEELPRFKGAIDSLADRNAKPHGGPLQVGFSYAFVGNAPPALAGTLLRRRDIGSRSPYMIFLLMAGSVCFQVWLHSDDLDAHVPEAGRLGFRCEAQLPKPEGGYFPITYSDPLQFDWSDMAPRLQPFEAFELTFNPQTTEGSFEPIPRR
ncbi:hypothetical protein L0F51_17700 [Afifella sp. H1R]|uniref:hypothetical protein n=1 Tax=Afifella sp. H1R TaxID=2908841 RepID=UPI001F41C280|nr:hypothetical protein [Afifella sp. H1R]MCF1505590.1 hypothetical protein [Afifella sp. H1R]